MKSIIYILFLSFLLAGCGTNKNYLERKDEDKALQDAIKKINKNPNDQEATSAIPVLYANIVQNNLGKIKNYSNVKDPSRFDKIISAYNDLQAAYNNIINSDKAFRLVTPQSYATQLLEIKEAAAAEYYNLGNSALLKPGRDNAKKAYTAFKKSEKYMPDYKDVSQKMNEAFDKAIVNVVINPVQDNSFFFNSGWGNTGYNYSNEYFQQTLVRELSNSRRYAARFYTDWEARRDQIRPDWVVDLTLRNMDIPQPMRSTYQRSLSRQIEVGRDTAGRVQYQTVRATLYVTRMSFTARAQMEVGIRDIVSNKNISYNNYSDDFRWEQESATYTGDSRALGPSEWNVINNNGYYNTPRKEEILNELYREIYPRVKNNITYAVDW